MTLALPVAPMVLLLAVPGPTRAAPRSVPPDAAPFVVRRWTTHEGLPQNTVNDIAQTPDGYLWLATFGGLVRFDGVRFTLLTSKTHRGLPSDRALHLAVDRSGRLWIGTESGLACLEGGRFTAYTTRDGLPDNLINGVYADSRGAVWVATQGGLARWEAGASPALRRITAPAAIPRQFSEDDAGALWLRTDAGMSRFDSSEGRFVPDPALGRGVAHILGRDREGGLWLSAAGELVRWRRGVRSRFGAEYGVRGEFVGLGAAPDGGYWLASQASGVWRFDPRQRGAGAMRRYPLPGGDAAYQARTVFVDQEGAAWVGTNVDGLLALRRRVFAMLPLAQAAASTTAILGDRSGRVWVGSNCEALNVLAGSALRPFRDAAGRTVQCAWSLAEGRGDTLWIGSWGDTLWRLARGRLERPPVRLPHEVVLAIHSARDGSLWVGTYRGGLAVVREGRVTVYDTTNGLPSNHVTAIVEGRGGVLWIGTAAGLTRVLGERLKTYTVGDGLSHDHVRAVLEDRDGTLWIGSYGGGLTRYRAGRFRAITTADGLFDDAVSAIVDDGRGNLWINSNRGIFRVSRASLDAFADVEAPAVHSVAYGEADGLETVEANGGFQPAAWRDPGGRVWFPTIRGVAILDPTAAVTNPRPPSVYIEQLVVDGRPAPLGDLVRIPSGSGNVEVAYTGLSSPAPEAVTFRYRLGGWDRDWVHVGERRVAYYTRLSPGSYTFTVSAANRDGVWSEAGASIRLVIQPPVHRSWWFQVLVAGSLAAGALGMVRFRLAQRARAAERAFAQRLLEGQEAERKRIASELHDSIGQDLLVVKNRAELALRSTDVSGPAREQLEQISAIASETLRHARDIAHNLRPAHLDRLGLAATIRAAVEHAGEASGIAFRVEIEAVDGVLPPEAEIGVFRIVQEAVSNILKHAQASQAEVLLARDEGGVRLAIGDNGRGFALDRRAGSGLGIAGMAERVKLMGGTLALQSAPGEGVRITVRIPARETPPPPPPPPPRPAP